MYQILILNEPNFKPYFIVLLNARTQYPVKYETITIFLFDNVSHYLDESVHISKLNYIKIYIKRKKQVTLLRLKEHFCAL